MINENEADDLVLRHLKESGKVYWDAYIKEVCIGFWFDDTPVLEVIVGSFNKGMSSHTVGVLQLQYFLSSINYQGSVEDILNVYDISMGVDGRLRYITPSCLKGTQYIIPESLGTDTPNKEETTMTREEADNILLQHIKQDRSWLAEDIVIQDVQIDPHYKIVNILSVWTFSASDDTHLHWSVGVDDLVGCIPFQYKMNDFLSIYGIGLNPNGRLYNTELKPPNKLDAIDPKAKVGNKKLSFHEMPILTLASIAKPFADGAKKYGLKNFYDFESYVSVYLSALKRHLMLFEAGQDNTSDSNIHHVDSMIAGLMVMREKMLVGKLVDDRKILDNDVIEKLEEMLNNDKV